MHPLSWPRRFGPTAAHPWHHELPPRRRSKLQGRNTQRDQVVRAWCVCVYALAGQYLRAPWVVPKKKEQDADQAQIVKWE